MASGTILVNLRRCTGCWTCSMGCKVINKLDDKDFRITVRTHGSGEGVDHPAGVWPNLRMSWQPIWAQSCTKCASRVAAGELPFCVYTCPTSALTFGEDAEKEQARLEAAGYHTFKLAAYENSKEGIVYAQ